MPSIYRVDKSDQETFTVVTNPIRTYVSSSTAGVTGSVFLFARHSTTLKDSQPDSSFVDSAHDDADLASLLQQIQVIGRDVGSAEGTTGVTGSFYGQYVSGAFGGLYYPALGDPLEIPSSASFVFPVTSGSFLVSGSTILPGGTGTFLTSGSFDFPNSELLGNFNAIMAQYLAAVAAQPQAARLKEVLDVQRFSPPPLFNSNTLRKLVIKDTLQPFYRTAYMSAHWAYTNYNTLNFFTASTVPTSSVMLFPNIDGGEGGLVFHEGYCSGTYTPSGSFSFDFYINPRYQPDQNNGHFKAGTIFHLSSTFALSLVSGSGKDANGRTAGFRLQLQLSRSAEISPSWVRQDPTGRVQVSAPSGTILPPSDLIFLSDDNCLQWNNWHHVVVRWGTDAINHGTGTFNVDGLDVGTFVVPSSSITPSLFDISHGITPHDIPFGTSQSDPSVLCLGNFYEGSNNDSNAQAAFFGLDPALRDGLNPLFDVGIETPASYAFRHPLNAELHDVAIRRCYLSDFDISTSASRGPVSLDNTFAFYVPPFFVEQSPYRQFVGDHGGVLVTPFEEVDGATTYPFNVALSFGVAGHYINLENFVKDFGSQQFPLLHHLTGVALQDTLDAETCNQFLYAQPFVAKRNLTVLPCDDGNFVPSFQLLVTETLVRAVDDLGNTVLSWINLDNMVNADTLLFGGGTSDDGTQPASRVNAFANTQLGATALTPFAPAGPATLNYVNTVQSGSDVEAGAPLDVFQQTQDPSSNEVVVFDISNMFYGFRMSPGTLSLNEPDLLQSSLLGSNLLSGSNLYVTGTLSTTPAPRGYNSSGPINITLADDSHGCVYRADCLTPQATWNSVGNLYYDEGLLVIKSPHLYFFGQNSYALNFRGEQHVHVMKFDVLAPANQMNSSSNPAFVSVPPTGFPNDPEDEFVYITGLNFHDTDMNVVMKTSLAQPIMKRSGDRILFKVKYDF